MQRHGFTSEKIGLGGNNCGVLVELHDQSPEIGQGVHGMGTKKLEEIGAGDQGIMFGYATDESEAYENTRASSCRWPHAANSIGYRLTEVRKNGTCPWIPRRQDPITIEYKNEGGAMVPQRVHTVLISTQHDEEVTNEKIAEDLMNEVIKKASPPSSSTPTPSSTSTPPATAIGGPDGDAGLTGRKIIIDTYGGWGATAAAPSRAGPDQGGPLGGVHLAPGGKSVVAAGLAKRCIVQLSYAIGVPEPLSVFVAPRHRNHPRRRSSPR